MEKIGIGVETTKRSFLGRREWVEDRLGIAVWERCGGESHGKENRHAEGIWGNCWRKTKEMTHKCRIGRVGIKMLLGDSAAQGKVCWRTTRWEGLWLCFRAIWLDKQYGYYQATGEDYGGNFHFKLLWNVFSRWTDFSTINEISITKPTFILRTQIVPE